MAIDAVRDFLLDIGVHSEAVRPIQSIWIVLGDAIGTADHGNEPGAKIYVTQQFEQIRDGSGHRDRPAGA